MGGTLMTNMFGIDAENLQATAINAMRVLEEICAYQHIIAQGPDRDLNAFEAGQAVQASGAGAVILPIFQVPVGKRLSVTRVLCSAPAASTNLAIYANGNGAPDPNTLRHVQLVPVLSADNIDGGFLVKGGLQIVAAIVAGAAGLVAVRLEGNLYDDGPRGSRSF